MWASFRVFDPLSTVRQFDATLDLPLFYLLTIQKRLKHSIRDLELTSLARTEHDELPAETSQAILKLDE